MRYCIDRESLLAAMRATSGLAPILMIAAVMSIYIGWSYPEPPLPPPLPPLLPPLLPPPPSSFVYAGIEALLLGTVLGFISWLCVILIARYFVTIDRANSAVYSELRSRFSIARQLGKLANEELEKKRTQAHSKHCPSKDTATNEGLVYTRTEVIACIERLEYILGDKALPQKNSNHLSVQDWVEGSGYITAWQELHRIEEALIVLAPLETVIADAYNDELRLEGSNIDNRDALLKRLRDSLPTLEARLCDTKITEASQSGSGTGDTVECPVTPVMEVLAREKLRHVKHAINQFRDERRRGLVHARNRLTKTVTVTGLVIFLIVALAVLLCVQRGYIVAAAAFYLVGAIVGLFNQLYLEGGTETATEDYGLASARLFHTPMISGLAALGGVLIIPMFSVLVNSSIHGKSTVGDVLDLTKLLNLTGQPFSIVLAAIFGLSPTILISRLQQEAEQYKADLKGTESPTRRSSVRPPS